MAYPKAEIDLAELEKLCALQCTDEEIAAWFNVSVRTIERRRKEKTFCELMERGKARGRVSVRRQQMKLLEQGNATMGIWLGKNVLGQTDQVFHEFNAQVTHVMLLPNPPKMRPAGEIEEAGENVIDCDDVEYIPLDRPTKTPFRP